MEQFTKNLVGGLRRFAMAGVGAITLTVDKSKEIIDQLAARGEVSAAEGQAVCDDLQKKLTEQVSAFTQKLRADYENLSFEQMLARVRKLTPEQKQRLIDALTNAPEADESETVGEPAQKEASAAETDGEAAVSISEPEAQPSSETAPCNEPAPPEAAGPVSVSPEETKKETAFAAPDNAPSL